MRKSNDISQIIINYSDNQQSWHNLLSYFVEYIIEKCKSEEQINDE